MCRKPNGPDVLLMDGASHMSVSTRRRTAAFTAVWGGNLADGCLVNVWGAFWAQCPLVVDGNATHIVVRESSDHKNLNMECNYTNIQFGKHRLFHLMTQTSPQTSEVMELPVILASVVSDVSVKPSAVAVKVGTRLQRGCCSSSLEGKLK